MFGKNEIAFLLHLTAGQDLPALADAGPFNAILIIENDVTSEWRNLVSKWLVRSGCSYMMAWGNECDLWDDSVDYANMEAFDYEEIPDEADLMTTWH